MYQIPNVIADNITQNQETLPYNFNNKLRSDSWSTDTISLPTSDQYFAQKYSQ